MATVISSGANQRARLSRAQLPTLLSLRSSQSLHHHSSAEASRAQQDEFASAETVTGQLFSTSSPPASSVEADLPALDHRRLSAVHLQSIADIELEHMVLTAVRELCTTISSRSAIFLVQRVGIELLETSQGERRV